MRKKNWWWVIGILAISTTSCWRQNDISGDIVNVKKEFAINTWEQLNANGGNIHLRLSSIEEQDCSARLNTSFQNTGSTFNLSFLSITPNATNCTGARTVVRDTLDLGTVQNGSYRFVISLKEMIFNEGTLDVTTEKINFNFSKTDGIEIQNKTLWRVPKETIWGYYAYDNGQNTKAEQWLDSLKTVATIPLSMPNVDYGYFVLEGGTPIWLSEKIATNKPNIRLFMMRLNAPKNAADIVRISNFFKQNVSGLDFKLCLADGRVL